MVKVDSLTIEGHLASGIEVDRAIDNFYSIVILHSATDSKQTDLVIEPVLDTFDFYFSAHHERFFAKYGHYIPADVNGAEVRGRYDFFRMKASPFEQIPEPSVLPAAIHISSNGLLTFGASEFHCWPNAMGERGTRNTFRLLLSEYIQQSITRK